MNELSLVQAIDGFSKGIIVAISPVANCEFDASFGQAFTSCTVPYISGMGLI